MLKLFTKAIEKLTLAQAFGRNWRILREMPFLYGVKQDWSHEDDIDVGSADKTPSFFDYRINHEFTDRGAKSWCWVHLATDGEERLIKVELDGYGGDMWDAVHYVREQGFLLERVTHVITYLEGDKRTCVWRTKRPDGFLGMYLESYRTRQFEQGLAE